MTWERLGIVFILVVLILFVAWLTDRGEAGSFLPTASPGDPLDQAMWRNLKRQTDEATTAGKCQ